ncbi:acetyltransferase, GNAT family protein [Trichomonas vaginalis G3]|uniref:Acetyltransferase, GNAT family protein n=1 Tax=Trichomonas vaginalis (strain ATCC PRA-98 / G3) TaxID=412133 RepID=A2F4K5_TRIV3|nr:peptide alpha-N-acetyltransferase protein [Trichomonas vaginalis G3]EAY00161.1 acetyltransferase, GNAT family protein [Trichomonas vaginalis G3]KAI5541126.1 peptide alpha-N-acetyltransferase protein [Trichomonas vaginalis G3]|eukprot:XP_001313090.1 acetyltransferase, GNAT family protein [Trichomonas vaginalis G3]
MTSLSTGPASKMTIGVYKMLYETIFATKLDDELYANIKNSNGVHGEIVYMNGDVACGIISGEINAKKIKITSIGVLEAYRRHGAAVSLVNGLIASQKNVESISCTFEKSNTALVNLFTKLEFKVAEEAGENVTYEKNLA